MVSPKTLGWGKTSDQLERFTALTDNYTFHEKTILDIGCGFADFYGFLKDKGILCNYIGVDIIPEFLVLFIVSPLILLHESDFETFMFIQKYFYFQYYLRRNYRD